jgi:hypothetical protein
MQGESALGMAKRDCPKSKGVVERKNCVNEGNIAKIFDWPAARFRSEADIP